MAGHLKLYGVPHGPACTLTPLTPSSEPGTPVTTSAPGTPTSTVPVTTMESSTTTSAAPVTSSAPVTTAAPLPGPSSTPQTPSTEGNPNIALTDHGLELSYVKQVEDLKAQILLEEKALEEERQGSIQSLQNQAKDLADRLQAIHLYKSQRARALDPLQSIQAAFIACRAPPPPASQTTLTWSRPPMTLQPSIVPSVAANASSQSFAAFQGQLAGHASLTQRRLGASLPNLTGIAPCSQSQAAAHQAFGQPHGIPQSSQSGASAYGAYGQNVWGHHIANQNEGDAAMTANASNPFFSADDVLRFNPIAKAVLSIPDESNEERAKLGKYIPELFSRQDGKIAEIRSKMTYPEFINMYMRMIMDMMREAPEQVPERLIFLHNIARKAAKYRWSDVRQCYAMAMKDIKHGRRGWGDDLKDITDDELPPSTYVPPRQSKNSSAPQHSASKGPSYCKDFNDRACLRPICKFDHNCYYCGQSHPARVCQSRQSAPPPSFPAPNSTA